MNVCSCRFFPWGTPLDGEGCRAASQVLKAATLEPAKTLTLSSDAQPVCGESGLRETVLPFVNRPKARKVVAQRHRAKRLMVSSPLHQF